MSYPHVKTTVSDDTGVTWHVVAHRTLNETEMMTKIQSYLVQRNGIRPQGGTSIIIIDSDNPIEPSTLKHH